MVASAAQAVQPTPAPTATPVPAPTPIPPPAQPPAPTTQAPAISVRPDGSISGVDGMLDQISGALMRQAMPMVKNDILPILQNDRKMQAHIGKAIGKEIAKPLWVLALIAGGYAGWRVYRDTRGPRSNPSRRGR